MSEIHTQYVFCKHKDIVGVSPTVDGNVLVTLSKDGVLLYEFAEQKHIQTWTLGGSSTRRLVSASVCFSTLGFCEYDYASVIQERTKKYLCLWNSECASLSEGHKVAIKHSKNIKILAVEGIAGISQGFLVYSSDRNISCLTFESKNKKGDLISIENEHVPEKATVLQAEVVLKKDCVVVAQLCKTKSSLELYISKLIYATNKNTNKNEFKIDFIGKKDFSNKGSEPISLKVQENDIYIAKDNLTFEIFPLEKIDSPHHVIEFERIWEKNSGACASLALSYDQFATTIAKDVENVRVICLAVIDKEYGYPLSVFYDKDLPLKADEDVIGIFSYDQETLMMHTKSTIYCCKVSVIEKSFGSILGCQSKGPSKNAIFVKADSKTHVGTSEITLGDIGQRVPSHDSCYEICESTQPETFIKFNQKVLTSFKDWMSKSNCKTSKEVINKVFMLLDSSLQDLSEDFTSQLWDFCMNDKYYKGLSKLCKRSIIPCHSRLPQVLQKLLELQEYVLFQVLLRKSSVLSIENIQIILNTILENDLSSSSARLALLGILSQNSNLASTSKAVRSLNLVQVKVVLECLLSIIKETIENNKSTFETEKTFEAAILSAMCIIDAHLGGLLLSQDCHQVIEQLQYYVQKQVNHERAMSRLVNYIRDLDSIEPIKQQDSYKPQDFAVELLNISVE